jgi:hypothetical protein
MDPESEPSPCCIETKNMFIAIAHLFPYKEGDSISCATCNKCINDIMNK